MKMKISRMNSWANIMSLVNHGDRRFKDKSDFDSISIFIYKFMVYGVLLFCEVKNKCDLIYNSCKCLFAFYSL